MKKNKMKSIFERSVIFHISVALAMLACFIGCTSSYKIQTQEITPLHVNQLKTFKFYNPANESEANFSFTDEDKKLLYNKVAEEFSALNVTSNHDADVIVRLQGGITVDVQNNAGYYSNYNSYYPRSQWYYYSNYNDIRDKSEKLVVLIVNFLDPSSKRLLWQGTASGKIGKSKNEYDLKLEEAVHLIFQELYEVPANK